MIALLARVGSLAIGVLCLAACYIPDQQYHRVCFPEPCSPQQLLAAVPQRAVQVLNPYGWGNCNGTPCPVETRYYQGWLEYREDGRLWDPRQKHAVVDRLAALTKDGRPVFVVVLVHGWHNNAAPASDDVHKDAAKFDNLMARQVDALHRLYELRGDDRVPNVMGIYVGWRGESQFGLLPSLFTVASRSDAADRIGYGKRANPAWQAMADSPTDFRDDMREIAAATRAVDPDSRLLVIGHSFGGRLLTSALLDDVVHGNPRPLGAGTTIVTLNSAIGADCFDRAYDRDLPLDSTGLPTWINITSENDTATDAAYPFAHGIGMAASCDLLSKSAIASIGHYQPYVTHRLSFENHQDPDLPPAYDETGWFRDPLRKRVLAYPRMNCKEKARTPACYDQADGQYYTMYFEGDGAAHGKFGPIWNIETDKTAIDFADSPDRVRGRHSGYVSTNLTRLLVELAWAH